MTRGAAVPVPDLEEEPNARAPAGGAVVHGDGRANISGVDEDAGLLSGLPHERGDGILSVVEVTRWEMPESCRVDITSPPGQEHFGAGLGIADRDQVRVQRLGVPPPAHRSPPGRRASSTVNTVSSTSPSPRPCSSSSKCASCSNRAC